MADKIPILRVFDDDGNEYPIPAIQGRKGDRGDGDMNAADYDPQGRKEDIFAALDRHTHSLESLGAAAEKHTHTVDEVSGVAVVKTFTATVGTTWTEIGGFFKQDITVSGILATDTPLVGVLTGDDNAKNVQYDKEFCNVFRIATAENTVTLWAEKMPSDAIPIQLKVVR